MVAALQAPEVTLRFQESRGTPAQDHRAPSPALDPSGKIPDLTDQVLDQVRRPQDLPLLGVEPEPLDRQRLLEPFAERCRRPGVSRGQPWFSSSRFARANFLNRFPRHRLGKGPVFLPTPWEEIGGPTGRSMGPFRPDRIGSQIPDLPEAGLLWDGE